MPAVETAALPDDGLLVSAIECLTDNNRTVLVDGTSTRTTFIGVLQRAEVDNIVLCSGGGQCGQQRGKGEKAVRVFYSHNFPFHKIRI